jgi:hypothetical protein
MRMQILRSTPENCLWLASLGGSGVPDKPPPERTHGSGNRQKQGKAKNNGGKTPR